MSDSRVSGPSPLPLHKGGEYDVQGDVATSWLILLPPLVGGFGEGSFRLFHFLGNMNFLFHFRGYVCDGTFI